MRLKQLVERRVSTSVAGESLRRLSPQEVQQVAGGIYYGGFGPLPDPSFPGLPPHGPGIPGIPMPVLL